MKIKAAVLHKINEPFQIETLELAPPKAGEVLVRISAAGVCHSDWHLATGATAHPLPVVVGHEGAGEIVEVGKDVREIKPGDFISLNWAPHCGHCFYCLNDRPGLCATYVEPIWAGTMMDGTPRLSLDGQPVYHYSGLACFAEYAVVPQESCVALPAEVPAPVAALIGCAVTTGVGAVLNTARLRPGAQVVVVGAGGVGLSMIMGARLAGASKIIAVDRTVEKGAMARTFGATHILINPENLGAAARELTGGRGADVVFEAIGLPHLQEACLEAVRPGGELILAGIAPMGSSTNFPSALLTRQEKRVTGCYYGSANAARDFPRYARLYLEGKLDLDRLISKTYTLADVNQAYADLLAGKLARGVILL